MHSNINKQNQGEDFPYKVWNKYNDSIQAVLLGGHTSYQTWRQVFLGKRNYSHQASRVPKTYS